MSEEDYFSFYFRLLFDFRLETTDSLVRSTGPYSSQVPSDFTMIRGIDSNTWYQITETRVDFNSSLQYNGFDIYFSLANPSANQYWQFFPLSGGNYQLRNRATSAKQLGTCYKPAEKSASKTQPCMVDAIASDKSQKWIVEYWYDGTTLRFNNVKNGTGLNMDVHPGNPLFMSQTTAKVPRQPAQHWEIKSIGQVDDGAFSTTFGSVSIFHTFRTSLAMP